MRAAIELVVSVIFIGALTGCASGRMRQQLQTQLSMGGRYRVQVLSLDPDAGKAWVKLWDSRYEGARETPSCPYKYEDGEWTADPNAIFDMRRAIGPEERATILSGGGR